jgi:DNA-binding MarR family transcriptional regulator
VPHTLASLVKKLKMPFSTASRVVWSLTEEGGDIGVVRYMPHPTDRRKKQLGITTKNQAAEVRAAVTRAMIGYYGRSVEQLKRAAQ